MNGKAALALALREKLKVVKRKDIVADLQLNFALLLSAMLGSLTRYTTTNTGMQITVS